MHSEPSNSKRKNRAPLVAMAALIVIGSGTGLWLRRGDATRAVSFAGVTRAGAASGHNLLLITLDTTRPDRLGCYGYRQGFSPAIDSLAARGVRFDDAVTCAPLTLPSHSTILTGLYPPTLGVRDNGTYRLGEEHTTLAEILKAKGYDTAAFVAAFVLDKRFGLDQGFDTYDFQVADDIRAGGDSLENQRRANGVSSSAIDWLRARKRVGATAPFFAWVHYYDPHHPYDSPIAEEARFNGRPAYDAEIAFMDRHIKRLLDELDAQGLREKTLIVVVSDHGEALSEHNEPHHGIFIYDSTMRAALIFSSPALFKQAYRVDDRVVGTVDVFPTVLELLGMTPPTPLDGQSLMADAPADRALYVESYYPREKLGCSPLFGLRRHRDKFILAPKPEYFDVKRDPRELANRFDPAGDEVRDLERQLRERMARWSKEGDVLAGARKPTADDQKALEALGYAGTVEQTHVRELPDPKDHLPIINQMSEVKELREAGRYQEALSVAQEVVAQCDGFDGPVLNLAWLYVKLDQRPKAIAILDDYSRRHPSADVLVQLAREFAAEKRWEEMEKTLKVAEIKDPNRGTIAVLRGDRWMIQERFQAAVEQYEKAIALDGERLGEGVRELLAEAKARLRE